MEPHDQAWRHILRHGALLPLYMLVLYDLALGRGLVARVFSLPGMNFLGQLSFSIFIWQNLFLMLGFAVVAAAPESTSLSFWFAVIGLLVMSVISTHFIEKPLARRLRKRGPTRDDVTPLRSVTVGTGLSVKVLQGVTDCPCVAT